MTPTKSQTERAEKSVRDHHNYLCRMAGRVPAYLTSKGYFELEVAKVTKRIMERES